MKYQRKSREDEFAPVDDTTRLCDLYSKEDLSSPDHGSNSDRRVAQIRQRLKALQSTAANNGIGAGEDLLMLNKNFSLDWYTLPIGKIDEVAQFFRTFGHGRKYEILNK